MRGSNGAVVALCFCVVLLAGCSSVQAGHAVRDHTLTANSDGVVVGLLDHGNYPITPASPLGKAGPRGHIVESQRLADFLVLPSDVDSAISHQGNLDGIGTALPLPTTALVDQFVSPGTQEILDANGYIAGFASQRVTSSDAIHKKAMTVMVARFNDPPAALAAAAQMAAVPPPRSTRTPLPIPGHPEALGSTFDFGDGGHYVEAYTARGPYVLYQFVNSAESVDVAAATAASAIDLQGPRIDAFKPTDPAQLADLPLDPTGLYAITLRDGLDEKDFTRGVYGAQGGLAYEGDTTSIAPVYAASGIDVVALGNSIVYRATDSAAAKNFKDALAKSADERAADFKPIPSVLGLPESRCYHGTTGGSGPESSIYQCVATSGRYAFRVFSHQEIDVLQRTAAQYLLLTNN